MGWGDELMAAGVAQSVAAEKDAKVIILDRHGRPRWHPAWDGMPEIVKAGKTVNGCLASVQNGPGCRPYIRDLRRGHRFWWQAYQPYPARVAFSPSEMVYTARAAGRVIVEPNLKPGVMSENKRWAWDSWQSLVRLLAEKRPDLALLQIGAAGSRRLEGVRFLETPDFRHAAACMVRARGAVLPEGGLHHAAAAAGIPAVVLYGHFISPAVTGYRDHAWIYPEALGAKWLGCGTVQQCSDCAAFWRSVEPGDVFELVNKTYPSMQKAESA